MDSKIPKIQGITIERRPRSVNMPNLPPGITVERNPTMKTSGPSTSTEEVFDEEDEDDEEFFEEDEEGELDKLPSPPQNLKLPPGILLQRKDKPKAPLKVVQPPIQLPPGITFERKTKDGKMSHIPEVLTEKKKVEKVKPFVPEEESDMQEEDEEEEEEEGNISEEEEKIDESSEIRDLMDLMTKGELEGEIEEEEEEEDEETRKRKTQDEEDTSDSKKSRKDDDEEEDEEDDEEEKAEIDKSKVSGTHLRKNIREVMDETKLDEATLAAQRQEAERLRRLQEQQRIIREVQRQMELSKQSEKVQNRMLSMLANSQTSILKTSSLAREKDAAKESSEPSLSVKLGNQQASLNNQMLAMLRSQRQQEKQPLPKQLVQRGMLSSSVTIAPIKRESIEEDKMIKRKGDIVTLSSDSDDDCIVLSDDDEKASEPDEDPTNSGMHTIDKYNVKDEQGRVLINVGHPSEEPDLFLAPQISQIIKPHQIGGIRFLYDNIVESVARFNDSEGFGCILAHSMGLGKTLQIVSFCDIFLRYTSGKKILCILPINTIQNWQAEFNTWLPKEPTDSDVPPRSFDVYVVNESHKNVHSRGKVILDWHKNGGVLLIGYELYRLLSLRKPIKSKRKKPDETENEKNRDLVEDIYAALVNPGPDLVVCDEGHRIKNSHATTSQALKNIRTKRRIVLTGYPLQNNLMEYWCMVDFVRPNYLGTRNEFSNMFERPIQNGQCIDSTPQDIRLMRYRAHVLHSLLEGFVQRRSHAVLQSVLPEKQEYVMLLRFTSFQRKLYDTFMNEVVRKMAVPNPLKAFAVCCKIWNHPDVLFNFLKKKGESIDLDLEEALAPPRFPLEGLNPGGQVPWTSKKGARTKRGRTPTKKVEEKKSQNTPGTSNQSQNFPQNQEYFNQDSSNSNYQYQNQEFDSQYQNHYDNGSSFYQNQQQGYQGDSHFMSNYYQQNESYDYQSNFESSFGQTNMDYQQNFWPQSSQWPNLSSSSSSPSFGGVSGGEETKKPDFGGVSAQLSEDVKEETKTDIKKDEIPYEWATELFKSYMTGSIENSTKMEVFFTILNESMKRQDRLLVFSQSLLTLDLIEDYLQRRNVPKVKTEGDQQRIEEKWARNTNYFRLDGSTGPLEREKLINEFNSNPNVYIFLVSTRAGSLGINLVGANRVIVFDASWNPCHDTQAVCRVYRYGQKKNCYVYRFVMDSCLEKKIYDRQINKQGMADRVVDELNPDAHLSIKEVTNLCWDDQPEQPQKDFSNLADKYEDDIVKTLVTTRSHVFSRAPFQHESLLIDRKEKKLSQAEKRLAKRSYELEKQAATQPKNLYQFYPNSMAGRIPQKPIASVKPMQSQLGRGMTTMPRSKWIPAEVWQKQGMSAQEMTLPLDVVIPTSAPDKTSIVLKAGQRVMVLKCPKGIYMQLENGKIIAIRAAFNKPDDKKNVGSSIASVLKNNPNVTITPKSPRLSKLMSPPSQFPNSLDKRAAEVNMAATKGRIVGGMKKLQQRVGTKPPPSATVARNPFSDGEPSEPTSEELTEESRKEGKKEGENSLKQETAPWPPQPYPYPRYPPYGYPPMPGYPPPHPPKSSTDSSDTSSYPPYPYPYPPPKPPETSDTAGYPPYPYPYPPPPKPPEQSEYPPYPPYPPHPVKSEEGGPHSYPPPYPPYPYPPYPYPPSGYGQPPQTQQSSSKEPVYPPPAYYHHPPYNYPHYPPPYMGYPPPVGGYSGGGQGKGDGGSNG